MAEVPITFTERVHGVSKLRRSDVVGFFANAWRSPPFTMRLTCDDFILTMTAAEKLEGRSVLMSVRS